MLEIKTQFKSIREGIFLKGAIQALKTGAFIVLLSPLSLFAQTGKATAKSTIKYARGFAISYRGNYKVLSILNYYNDQTDTLRYLLLDRKAAVPKGFSNTQVIRTPVKSLITMSSMHIALTEFAGAANLISGQGNFKYVSSPLVRKNIKAGKVKEVGLDGELNQELIISMRPDVLMVMGNPSARFSKYQTLVNAKVPVLAMNEWLETNPLGRMEWVKLVAALTNNEAMVNQKFEKVEKEYARLVQVAKKAKTRPLVITGMPFKGTWNVPDADSYNTKLFHDAGASYHWSKQKGTGSLPLTFEAVAPVALKADYWLNIGYVNSKLDVIAKDERFTAFKPFKTGKMFNYNKRINDVGSNDYWESGGVNPHLILADLIKILHPELLPNYKLFYYKQLQ
ncbi:ABC transporter substrate-binding protein [Desertivirga brevis]|uniref:ABC transporter substrate-binding protein n=1 Tax=Desertivirga brevis TaxID=2810310 RepID=UPI001A959DCE|nr:ABC transporter substrate-binding protein [Pedobacter sp. SYSU D00873]